MQAADRLRAVLDELSDPWTVLVESLLVRQAALGDVFRECLIRWIERLSQASREGLRPVLDEYLMASDLLDEIDRAFERAARATRPATVPTNGVVVVAGIVSDESPRARSARRARAVLRAIARRPDPLIDSDDAEAGVVS